MSLKRDLRAFADPNHLRSLEECSSVVTLAELCSGSGGSGTTRESESWADLGSVPLKYPLGCHASLWRRTHQALRPK